MKNIILLLLVFTFILSGCNKLDFEPEDTLTDAAFWKTPNDFKKGANNLYYSLEEFPAYDPSAYGDVQSDIAYNSNNAISNGSYQTSETSSDWNTPYVYIRRSNNIIEKGMASEIRDDVKVYVAEARFFRAYNYWRLLHLFGGVPLIDKVLDVNSPELYSQRATKEEIADFILNDLKEAAAELPLKSELAAADAGRITRGAADALRARVALFIGTWNKFHSEGEYNKYLDIAIEAAGSVITSNEFSLYNNKGSDSYRYLFIEEGDDSPENILDRRYQKDIIGQVFPALIQRLGYLPTKKLADMYVCNDGLPINVSPLFQGYQTRSSEFQNRDPRMTSTIMIPGTLAPYPSYPDGVANWPFYPQRIPNTGYITYKYISEDHYANSQGESPNFSFDNHLIRYAEVLLIFAEAKFEKESLISDGDLDKSVNLLRARVGIPPLSNAFVAGNGLNMQTEIRRERTVELALENFRYDDLRRWKTAETELPQAIKGIKVKGTEWTNPIIIDGINKNIYQEDKWQKNTDEQGFIVAEQAASRTFDPAKHYWRPIPTKEILLNPMLEQNPNW